jgi:RNA polymerase sigma-70 factor (ECF subfamily)
LLKLCLKSGSELFWHEFICRTQPLIAAVVIKSVRRWTRPLPTLVDDLVQETYLKLCANDSKALREFEATHENALYGFLKVLAAHVVHDHFRGLYSDKRGRGVAEAELDEAMIAQGNGGSSSMHSSSIQSSSTQMERAILIQEIGDCLEARASGPNSPRDCAIFWLYYAQGYTAKAIAQLPSIGLTVKGVESTILRLTRLVREGLTGKEPADDDD